MLRRRKPPVGMPRRTHRALARGRVAAAQQSQKHRDQHCTGEAYGDPDRPGHLGDDGEYAFGGLIEFDDGDGPPAGITNSRAPLSSATIVLVAA